MANIAEIWRRIKNGGEGAIQDWGIVAIVLFVGLGSFGLGRLSAFESASPVVSIGAASEAAKPRGMYLGGAIVASRKGRAYHFPWCAGAQAIAAANRVWFASEEKARRAGYAPAKNCAGLGGE